MYAIVECGGRQYRIEPGQQFEVNKVDGEKGTEVILDRVLLVSDDSGTTTVGTPIVSGAKVTCKVVRQGKGRKIHGFTFKAKKNVFRHYGHRQMITLLSVDSIG